MLSAVLSTSTANKIAKKCNKKQGKKKISVPDCDLFMDPDSMSVVMSMARGHRKGRISMSIGPKNYQEHKKLLEYTLGCNNIIYEIMSNYSDQELLSELMKYLVNFPDVVSRENCLPILKQRRVWYCNDNNQFEFIHECLKFESFIPDTELVLGFSQYSGKFTSTIEKFSTIHLNSISISKRKLIELINASTSRIQHLKFTNSELSDPYTQLSSKRIIRIAPSLKKLTFNIEHSFYQERSRNSMSSSRQLEIIFENPVFNLASNLDLNSSNIEELEFPNVICRNDISLISLLRQKLTRLLVENPIGIRNLPNLEYLESNFFPMESLQTTTLCIHKPSALSLPATQVSKVKKIILLNSTTSDDLVQFMRSLSNCYFNCEELIISETFLNALSKTKSSFTEDVSQMKRVIIKHSDSTQPSQYGALKFALQQLFSSKTVISTETIQKDESKFGTLQSSNRLIQVDCYEDILFKRIESAEKHFKAMDNSHIKDKIKKMKKEYSKGIVSNNFSKFSLIDDSLNMLEGLKRNKQLMLQTIHQAIKNYHDIFVNDSLYISITEKLDNCMHIIEQDYFDESKFSHWYTELESLFHQMIQVVEDNGFPSKVLFNEQWFNEQIVEIYSEHGEQVYVYEDSELEMEEATCLMTNEEC